MKAYKILIVDDDLLILQAISSALEQEGYNVTTAANGKNAIELIFINWSTLTVRLRFFVRLVIYKRSSLV